MSSSDGQNGPVSTIPDRRRIVAELALIAIVAAVGVNLATSYLTSRLGAGTYLSVGLVCMVASSAYFCYRLLGAREYGVNIRAVAVMERSGRNLVSVPGYRFTHEISETGRAVFAENAALRRQWEEDGPEKSRDSDRWRPEQSDGARLLAELAEFYVLDSLALHLSSRYGGRRGEDVEIIQRGGMPDVLLGNRVIEMLTKEMKDRPAFPAESLPSDLDRVSVKYQNHPDGIRRRKLTITQEVVWQTHPDGLRYHRLELRLPKRSKISRTDDGLLVENDYVRISIKIEVDGTVRALPGLYESLAFGSLGTVTAYSVKICANIRVKWKMHLRPRAFRDYEWAESYLEKLREECDFASFLESASWRSIELLLTLGSNEKRQI